MNYRLGNLKTPETFQLVHAHGPARRLRPGTFRDRLAARPAEPERKVAGLHFFTFNEIEVTERWRQESIARLLTA